MSKSNLCDSCYKKDKCDIDKFNKFHNIKIVGCKNYKQDDKRNIVKNTK